MAFCLRIGECWARCIQEMEERKDLKAIAPEPAAKRRKVVQHFLPEARREKAVHLPQFVQFVQAIAVGSEVANPTQKLNVCRVMCSCVLCDRNCFMQYHKDLPRLISVLIS